MTMVFIKAGIKVQAMVMLEKEKATAIDNYLRNNDHKLKP
jgi:hypothetical protein